MHAVAAAFRQKLGMTNGCLPASLLLHEVLSAHGVPSRLRHGYLVLAVPSSGASPPQLLAVAHLWVEAEVAGSLAVLDVGSALAADAGLPSSVSTHLSHDLPPGATRADLADPEMAASAAAAAAAMAAMADASITDEAGLERMANAYWMGAPPQLQAFRQATLQQLER
jgi:hypothetical protein